MTSVVIQPDFDFGDLITVRGGGAAKWVLAVVLLPVGLVSLAVGVTEVARGRMNMMPLAVIGLSLTALGLIALQYARLKTEFYLHGVIVKRGGKVRRFMPYAACEKFTYGTTRHYYNGLYTGTLVDFQMKAEGWKPVRWFGNHKEKPKGWAVTFLGRAFKGEDELDGLKLVIADRMMEKWVKRMKGGEVIEWRNLELREKGITPLRGKWKGRQVAWDQVEVHTDGAGGFAFRSEDEEQEFLHVTVSVENFWVFLSVLEKMSGAEMRIEVEDSRLRG